MTRIKIVNGENVDQLRDPSEEAALGFVASLREAGREVYRDFSKAGRLTYVQAVPVC